MVANQKLKNGFEYLQIKNSVAEAKVALQGAHIFEYKSKKNLLWLSDTSTFEYGKAIRGGIPLCWPAFGTNNPALPQHGFARTSLFTLVSVYEQDRDKTILTLQLKEDKNTLALWDYSFELTLIITISDTLSLQLQTTNKGKKPFVLTQAFHTYFNVKEISEVTINGLEEKPYFDALDGKNKYQKGAINFTQEFDNVYQDVYDVLTLQEEDSTVQIVSKGSKSCIVWNPWIIKCANMSGMSKDAYKKFACIETANAFKDFKILKSQESHTLEVTFTTL